jgi:hypothetical protein
VVIADAFDKGEAKHHEIEVPDQVFVGDRLFELNAKHRVPLLGDRVDETGAE